MKIMASAAGNDRQSRRELLDTIETQKEQITRYEARLRDVVRAYKGLVKEKEALESSLTILGDESKAAEKREEELSGAESSTSDAETKTPGQDLSKRVSTLTASLATVTSEKSRLEAIFQEDKKKLRTDLNEKDQIIVSLKAELKAVKEKSRIEIDDAKSKLIIERHNREKETNDNALMLRELQKLITDERTAREKLESELQQSKDSMKALQLAGTYNAEFEKRVRELEGQLKAKNVMIEELKVKANATPPELLKLKEELTEMKMAHRHDLERAEQKASKAEERSVSIQGQQESRVANLESRLQELSETVGTYDRLRQADQSAMQKLRERIAQLDQENKHLQSSPKRDQPFKAELDGDNDSNLDVQSLIERILRLRTMLRDANRRSENPVDLDELLDYGEGEKKWKKSYYSLKEEFEKFKLTRRTPSPFLSSPSKKLERGADDEVDELIKLKSHVQELNEKIKYTNQQLALMETKEAEFKSRELELNDTISALKEKAKKDASEKDAEMRVKLAQLEGEVQKQRDRCLTIISEKEEEIANLKSSIDALKGEKDEDYLSELTRAENSKLDTLVLHYSEESGHTKLELRELRAKKLELESALHELQMSALAKEQKYQDEIELMNENMLRLKRMATKEGANLEYLKNVCLTYMLSTDAKSKEHMLKAIGAVLMFTPMEVKQVHDYNASWWPASTASGKKGGATSSRR